MIGTSDFKKVVDDNGYYVDKSMLMKDLSKYLSKQYESQVVLLTK